MNQTVELVKLWGDYESAHPNPTIEDFCRNYLSMSIKQEKHPVLDSPAHPDLNGALIKLISRIGKFQEIYVNKALAGTGIEQIEEFGIMASIVNQKNPIKSEAIFSNMLELSSGTNMLIRLIAKKLISEYADKEDKRVKRVQLTAKGIEVFKHAKQQVLKVVGMLAQELSDDDKQLCLHILKPINDKFSPVIQKQKQKNFEEIFQENSRQQ